MSSGVSSKDGCLNATTTRGFTPVITDTYEKADRGLEECSCRSEGSSAQSSSVAQLNRQTILASVAYKQPASWALPPNELGSDTQ